MAKQFLCKVIGHDYDISILGEVGGSLRVVADQCTRCGHTTRSLRPEAIIQAIRPANDKYGRVHTDGSRSGGQPLQSDALQADALDFGNELIFACAGLRHEPIDTEAIFSITWDGLPYDVTIRAAQEQANV